jgi:thioredoxin-dependent peroxiredoxin
MFGSVPPFDCFAPGGREECRSPTSEEIEMSLQLGDTAPDFTAETTRGRIRLHQWLASSWCLFVSHPRDFTPVCTTELGQLALLQRDFDERGVKIMGLSIARSHRCTGCCA